ncbi:MAG TPA: glycosyltransferase family 4 protein [Gammaproteobacteria bacterium]|nr:glycosyltransferase family 4 protein [Gammaproteobacteria bacterium]
MSVSTLPIRNGESRDCIVIINASKEGPCAPLGGIQKAIIGQIAALRSSGVDVCLLSAAHRCASIAREMGCTVHYDPRWHNGFKPLAIPDLARTLIKLRKKRPAAILHHSGRTWLWGHMFFFGIPNIAILHRELIRPYRFFRRWLALSPGYAAQLQSLDRLSAWRLVQWAPNCLMREPDPARKRSSSAHTSPEPGAGFTLGFLGRASEGKGLDMLLRAIRELRANGTDIRLKIAGTIDPWIFTKADEYDLKEAIDPLGWQENTNDFFGLIDCLVLPSEKESFGLVLIEAMEAKLPVIATRCNGPESIVLDNETGLLVPIGSQRKLIQAIAMLANNPILAKQLGEKGLERVQINFTPRAISGLLLASLTRLGAKFTKP